MTDIKSVFEPAQAYVMLSRVQCIDQLFILGEVPISKFYTSEKALTELKKLEENSVNKNPPSWEQENPGSFRISLLNCRDIKTKYLDIKSDLMIQKSDVICLNETWLNDDDDDKEFLQFLGYKLKLNSAGSGKGIASYYKEDNFHFELNIKMGKVQIMKLSSEEMDIINIYRSPDSHRIDDQMTIQEIQKTIQTEKFTLILGDMNLCYMKNQKNILIEYLETLGFKQLVTESTHIEGGHLDLLFSNHEAFKYDVDIIIFSTYYTYRDHDALLVTVKPTEKKSLKENPIRRSDRLCQKRKRKLKPEEVIEVKKQKLID